MTQLEALSSGIPVITTPNCGEVVTDSYNGFIIPPRQPQALTEALEKFLQDPELLHQCSKNALVSAKKFSLNAFAENLQTALETFQDIKESELSEK